MKPDAKNEVALKSKEQAQSYYDAGKFGRAFAHYLVALKLMPEWKNELKGKFSSTLCSWGSQLELQQRFKDLFNCYEQAVEIFPENEEVVCNLGAHLFRLGHLREAAHYFRQALENDDDYLPAYRNLQSVCNVLIERWHFRMLNDSYRNEAYREAILKKVRQGFTSVLDIGTGTGLLSLYAVTSGARDVHACDYSPTMCSIAQDVLQANKMADSVTIINKLSNSLTIPQDLPRRKSLVVTETMDAGLLGEHLLQTLLHAWDQLLLPPCPQLLSDLDTCAPITQHGVVVPFGARLWAAPIRCPSIARRSFLTDTEHFAWNFKSLWLFSDFSEPYDTENLRVVKDCKFLSDPVEIFTFDFNNPSQLKQYFEGKNDCKCVSFLYDGKSDAVAVWFDLILDEDITISSSPFLVDTQCCWEQAIFRFSKPQDSVKLSTKCVGGKLVLEVVSETIKSLESSDENLSKLQSSLSSATIISEIAVSPEMICFLNNKELQNLFYRSPKNFNAIGNVLDLSPFPLFGLRCLQLKGAKLVCVLNVDQEVSALKEFVKDNHLDQEKVRCLKKSELDGLLSESCEQFDVVVNNIFELTGEIKESNICMIPRLTKLLRPDGILGPVNLTVRCQLIDCEWTNQTSRVADEELTQRYRIAEFINVYQVSQQIDVDLKYVCYTPVSEEVDCLQLASSEMAADLSRSEQVEVTAVRDGRVTAVPVWYTYQLFTDTQRLSTLTDDSHINQVVFVVDPPLHVTSGETITVSVTYHCGVLRLKLVP
uniref:Uncharacterized protein n=2 Tax=Graphocephala atropunctata TaxID=36148 RepID=A0A1B6LWV0_9HEMI